MEEWNISLTGGRGMLGTATHEEHVAQQVMRIASYLGLEQGQSGKLHLAALMHDVGKVGIPTEIVAKPAALSDIEYAVIKAHTILGWNIVRWTGLHEIADWVRHHHERWDGAGYPDGLVAERIPLESRIIFVADTFDALTANRPYRLGRSADEAMHEITLHAGSQFDPECVEALAAVYSPPPNGA